MTSQNWNSDIACHGLHLIRGFSRHRRDDLMLFSALLPLAWLFLAPVFSLSADCYLVYLRNSTLICCCTPTWHLRPRFNAEAPLFTGTSHNGSWERNQIAAHTPAASITNLLGAFWVCHPLRTQRSNDRQSARQWPGHAGIGVAVGACLALACVLFLSSCTSE